MVRVNGIDVNLFVYDNDRTFYRRVAAELNTIPKLLLETKFPPEEDNKVIDLLSIIKNNKKIIDLDKFLKQINFPSVDTKNLVKIWLVLNTSLNQGNINHIGNQLVENNIFPSTSAFTKFWDEERLSYRKKIELEITINKKLVETQDQVFEEISNIKSGKKYTEISIDRLSLQVELKTKEEITILEVFNSLLLDKAIPFAYVNDYYKILKDFAPSETWIPQQITNDVLNLRFSDQIDINTDKYDDYKLSKIYEENGKILMSGKLSITPQTISKEMFISRFERISDIRWSIGEVIETDVTGIFYFPDSRINSYVFSDLIMNDPLFSYFLSIDESTKATKKKSEEGQSWLYVYYSHPKYGNLTASISQKYATHNDIPVKKYGIEVFKIGSPYIRVRVKGVNKQSIVKFRKFMSKILTNYMKKEQDIIDIYRKYIPTFGEYQAVEDKDVKMKHRLLAEDVFVKNYTRTCKEDRMPTIIDEERKKILEAKGHKVVKFPRDKGDGPGYPSDGINQKYYACLNPKYSNPGLQENSLSNAESYPFVPCCFANPQETKNYYQHYYNNKPLEEKYKKQQDLIKTDKILTFNKYGILPTDLSNLFEMLDPSHRYVRIGVLRNQSSFINAVILAMNKKTGIFSMKTIHDVRNYVSKIRNKLADLAVLGRQCMYDMDVLSIREKMVDEDEYFDPSLYIQLLEEYYSCNIFLFNREGLFLPRYLQTYEKMNRNGPSIFIYEHMGSESDHARYPQCELIVRWKLKTTLTTYSYPQNDSISTNIDSINDIMMKTYNKGKLVGKIEFPLKAPIIGQKIDTYGKCRQLNIMVGDKEMTIFTQPLPPLNVPEVEDMKVFKSSTKMMNRLLESEAITLTTQTFVNNIGLELSGYIGNVSITIPTINYPSTSLDKLDKLIYPLEIMSSLEIYNTNKKMARYMSEYILWLFSRYLHENNIDVVSDKVISDFSSGYIEIDPDFAYSKIKKTFETDKGFMKKGKLILQNREIRNRLLYVLKLYSIRNLNSLIDYHNRKTIKEYYRDVTDFDQNLQQIILYGSESVDKLIQEYTTTYRIKFSYKLFDEVNIGERNPYFFSNPYVENGTIYLAQNIGDIGKAIDIAKTWTKQSYNKTFAAKDRDISNTSFTLYRYINKDDINEIIIGKETNIRILGYKIANIPFYTVLLRMTN